MSTKLAMFVHGRFRRITRIKAEVIGSMVAEPEPTFERTFARVTKFTRWCAPTRPTGEKCLFVNSGFTTHIVDLPRPESDAVLGLLFQHVAKPEFTCRHRWRINDVAFWDNRCTQHYAGRLPAASPHHAPRHHLTSSARGGLARCQQWR